MTQKELDDLRNRIHIDAIDTKEKKKLFQEFEKHGGIPTRIEGDPDSSKSLRGKARYKEYIQELKKNKAVLAEEINNETIGSEDFVRTIPQPSLFGKVQLYFKGLFNGVTTLSYGYSPSFINLIRNSVQVHLLNIHYLSEIILFPKSGGYPKFKEEAFQRSPFFLEIILRLYRFYNERAINHIVERGLVLEGSQLDQKSLRAPIYSLLKSFYILINHQHSLHEALSFGLTLHEQIDHTSRSQHEPLLQEVGDGFRFLFREFYPKLYLAFSICNERIIEPNQFTQIRSLLKWRPIDEAGKVVTLDHFLQLEKALKIAYDAPEPVQAMPKEEPISSDLFSGSIDQDLITGRDFFSTIQFDKYPAHLPKNDEITTYWKILDSFEKEFSFILTSQKINLVPRYENRQKIDYKSQFQDAYYAITKTFDLINEYVSLIQQYQNLSEKEDQNNRTTQKQLEELEKKIQVAKSSSIKNFKGGFENLHQVLTNATRYSSEILPTPHALIQFESFDGKKYLKGKSHSDALVMFKSFVAFIFYYLEQQT